MDQVIFKILNNDKNITKIQLINFTNIYCNKSYKYIFKFIYTILDLDISIVMGIPVHWDRNLIDIYIENYKEFKFIPHMDTNGKICLFDLEGVLIDKNFEGLLCQTLKRLNNTLLFGIKELNKNDFIEEFEQYWGRLPNAKVLKSMIDPSKNLKLIKYANNQKSISRNKKEKYINVLKRNNNYSFFTSDSEKDFNLYKDINTIKNGIYIYIDSKEYIYPPDWRSKLNVEYINNLLNNNAIDKDTLTNLISKCKSNLMLIFNIKQPNNYINIFGVIIKKYNIDKFSDKLILKSNEEIIPCWLIRCDKEFLLNRGGALSNIYKKRVLVIGCGSIGGYLINEIVKTGINNIDIVDNDLLKEENIYRHFLGMEYVNNYKSKSLVDYVKKNIPNVNIRSIEDFIEDAIDDESISLSEYDLIISAVGNHNVNRWINEYIYTNKIKVPVMYLWNEVLGIGNHVAFISITHEGCYECFFGESEEGIYDKTSYCEKGQVFTKRLQGCGSTYLPFSSINSLTTVIMAIDVIKKYLSNQVQTNILISRKGDSFYLTEAGFKTSNRYNKQNEIVKKIEGSKFNKKNCLICGDN